MQGVAAQIKALDANLVAICPQRPEFLRKMREAHGLTFKILRDEGNRYAGELGLRYVLPDYLQEAYRNIPLDLPRLNGESSWSLAMPSRLVINRSGVIVAADCDPDYTRRPEPEKTLEDLRRIS